MPPDTRPLAEDSQNGAFGRLLRFWRNVRGHSQAQLAHMLETPSRHVSFLETGRSNPSRGMIGRLAAVLGLNERETNVLLVAAGLLPETEEIDLDDDRHHHLRRHLGLLLQKQDPYPGIVVDRCGEIKMCNRAWILLVQAYLGGIRPPARTNLFHLYFSDEGLRQRIRHWERLACILLLKVQEQQLLTGDSRLAELMEWLQAYPGVPADWATRAQGTDVGSSYEIHLHLENITSHSLTVISNLEPSPDFSAPQVFIHNYFPQDAATEKLWLSFYNDNELQHPLLYY
ncbi:helix-turn-helix domain-containing protein [Exilibacterium tricleocarpae]|uniref:Helix-turn-helix domain-containing protein n=1 Tax=Exilibacterium tricleocarpae TaxID=2591008 RepID=A0A545SLY8_9GAMM|nr:helix-turn-helix domain-containing protein [Exilibacterium tricleocarpae]TQV65982.1 helix-turn-helix domain-containing protein [Exilibacterium tricleocarpae]